MKQIILKGFNEQEIKGVSGNKIYIQGITIPKQFCNSFNIIITTKGINDNSIIYIYLNVNPYQKDTSCVFIDKYIEIKKEHRLYIKLHSAEILDFTGDATLDYTILHHQA